MTTVELIKSDLYRYSGDCSWRSFYKYFFKYSPGFKFSVFFRLIQGNSKFSFLGIIGRLYYRKLTYKYGFQIPTSVKVGKGLQIMHFGHIVVNSKAIIGDNCNIYHGVTIGETFKGGSKGVPTLGNKVWVGPGAVIVGGVTIGDSVLIAPNAYVNFSVPSESIVLGNPGKIVPKSSAIESYILNVV